MDQILSQEEVNALLDAVNEGSLEVENDEGDVQNYETYDLSSQDKIIRGRMAALEIIHDRLNRYLQIALGTLLRKVVEVQLEFSGLMKFGEFINQIIAPMSLNLYKMPPLRGVAILALESQFIFSMVNTFFGGQSEGKEKDIDRDFTLIEMNIVRKVVRTILTEFEKAWHPVYEIHTSYVRTETNPQFIGVIPNADVVINTQFSIEFDNCVGSLNLIIPYSMIEPIKQTLTTTSMSEEVELDMHWVQRLKEEMLKTQVNLQVELGKSEMQVQEMMELKVGDVIMLDSDATQPLTLRIENVEKMRGMPIVHKGHVAIRITSTTLEDEPQASL